MHTHTFLPGQQRRVSSSYSMFWVTDMKRVIGDQHNQPCLWQRTNGRKEKKRWVLWMTGCAHQSMSAYAGKNRTSVLNRYWERHISDKNGIWYGMPPSFKGPYGRWLARNSSKSNSKNNLHLRVDLDGQGRRMEWWRMDWPKFAACMRIYTKPVCNKKCRGEPSLDLDFAQPIVGESVTWVTEVCLWEHEWVMDTTVTLKENEILEALNYEIELPCPLQWGLLWFSAPTSLTHKFMNNGQKIEKFRKKSTMRSSCRATLSLTGLTPQEHCLYGQWRCCCAVPTIRTGNWKKMQEWDVDDERIAKLTAIDEEVKCVPADNWSHCSRHHAELNFCLRLRFRHTLPAWFRLRFHLHLLCDESNLFHHRP